MGSERRVPLAPLPQQEQMHFPGGGDTIAKKARISLHPRLFSAPGSPAGSRGAGRLKCGDLRADLRSELPRRGEGCMPEHAGQHHHHAGDHRRRESSMVSAARAQCILRTETLVFGFMVFFVHMPCSNTFYGPSRTIHFP